MPALPPFEFEDAAFVEEAVEEAVAPELDPQERADLERQLQAAREALGRARTFGAKASARKQIREVTARLRGGVIERETATWLKKRIAEAKGEFDVEAFQNALRWLPGWSIEPDSSVEVTLTEDDIGAALRGFVFKDKGVVSWRWHGEDSLESPETFAHAEAMRAHAETEGWSPSEVTFREYTNWPGHGEYGFEMRASRLGKKTVPAVEITASNGERKAFRAPPTESIWKWMYEQGLASDARRTYPDAERAVPPERKVGDASYRTCGVCFRAVATVHGRIAHHGYQFPGHRFRLPGKCFGSGRASWETSNEVTRDWLRTLESRSDHLLTHLRDLPNVREFRILVPDLDAEGKPKRDSRGNAARRTEVVTRSHPWWSTVATQAWKEARGDLMSLWDPPHRFRTVPWYRAAIRRWTPASGRVGAPQLTDADILRTERFSGDLPSESPPPALLRTDTMPSTPSRPVTPRPAPVLSEIAQGFVSWARRGCSEGHIVGAAPDVNFPELCDVLDAHMDMVNEVVEEALQREEENMGRGLRAALEPTTEAPVYVHWSNHTWMGPYASKEEANNAAARTVWEHFAARPTFDLDTTRGRPDNETLGPAELPPGVTAAAVYGPGLDQHVFPSYDAFPRRDFESLGWVETARSGGGRSEGPQEVQFFNKLIGGEARLFRNDDGSYEFFAAEGWLGKVLAKKEGKVQKTEKASEGGTQEREGQWKREVRTALLARGWTKTPGGDVEVRIAGGTTGGALNPKGQRAVFVHFTPMEVQAVNGMGERIAGVRYSYGEDPVKLAEALDQALGRGGSPAVEQRTEQKWGHRKKDYTEKTAEIEKKKGESWAKQAGLDAIFVVKPSELNEAAHPPRFEVWYYVKFAPEEVPPEVRSYTFDAFRRAESALFAAGWEEVGLNGTRDEVEGGDPEAFIRYGKDAVQAMAILRPSDVEEGVFVVEVPGTLATEERLHMSDVKAAGIKGAKMGLRRGMMPLGPGVARVAVRAAGTLAGSPAGGELAAQAVDVLDRATAERCLVSRWERLPGEVIDIEDEPSTIDVPGSDDVGPAPTPETCDIEPPTETDLTLAWVAQPTNIKTGPIPTAYVVSADPSVDDYAAGAKASCVAVSCALLDEGCYSHSGQTKTGLASMIKALLRGADRSLEAALATRDPDATAARLTAIGDVGATPWLVQMAVYACRRIEVEGLVVIGYTHGWRLPWTTRPLRKWFRASCNTLSEADEALAAGWKVAVVLPAETDPRAKDITTPAGVKVKVCPAFVDPAPGRDRVTCNGCRLCDARGALQVIGFPAHGSQERRASARAGGKVLPSVRRRKQGR